MAQKPVVLFTASTCSHILNFHRPYLREFRRLGWEVHVACGGPMYPIPEADRLIELPFKKDMLSPKNLVATKILRREIKTGRYSLITAHTSLAAFFTRLAVKGLKAPPPLVNVVHGYLFDEETPAPKRRLLTAAERLTSKQTGLLLAMNEWDYDFAKRKKLSQRIELIPGMGVDFERLNARAPSSPRELRGEHGIRDDDFLLIYAAEFSDRKNQAMLVRAMPLLPERVKLLLPGEGAMWEDCAGLARSLSVEERVIMPGHVNDMPAWYSAADAAVSSSRSEGLPFNVMEAMHFSLPVVASRVKGHTDLVADGKTGILFPYDDEKAFEEAVLSLLEAPARAKEMGSAARQSVERFSLAEVMPVVMQRYLELINNS